jgi:hypothetical protein
MKLVTFDFTPGPARLVVLSLSTGIVSRNSEIFSYLSSTAQTGFRFRALRLQLCRKVP